MRGLLTGFAAALLIGMASPSSALTFKEGGDASMNCIATFDGQIEPGDADRMKAFLARWWAKHESTYKYEMPRLSICLNSPGGSLAEAVKMADALVRDNENYWMASLGTAVPAGAVCESACAVFFMAGGEVTESDVGRLPDRKLHVNGRLGFHAPAIGLSDRTYNKEEVDRAFKIAILSIGEVAKRMDMLRLRHSVLRTMLETAPDDMYYVESIGDAAHWNIQVVGLPLMRDFSPANVDQACYLMHRSYEPEDGISATNFADQSGPGQSNEQDTDVFGREDGFTAHGATKESFVQYASADGQIEFVTDDGEDLMEIGCSGYVDLSTLDMAAETINSNNWFMHMPNYWMYPARAKFADLVAAAGGQAEMPANAVLRSVNWSYNGRCQVFKGNQKIDDEACLIEGNKSMNAQLQTYAIVRFNWPSGGVTVLESAGGVEQLNGAKTGSVYPYPGDLDYGENTCLKSQKTGNTFCFSTNR